VSRAALGFLASLVVTSCSTSHVTRDAAGADGPPGTITFHADMAVFSTCTCHHGCGPGIDGSFVLHVTNDSAATPTIRITEVTLVPIGTPGGAFVATRDGWFRVTGAAADGSVSIAPGASSTFDVAVYLDLPMTLAGTHRIDVDLVVDRLATTLTLPSVSVPLATGCP
jgi:hypothetical protein